MNVHEQRIMDAIALLECKDAALWEAVEAMERSERVLATLDLPPGSTPLVADLRTAIARCRAELGDTP